MEIDAKIKCFLLIYLFAGVHSKYVVKGNDPKVCFIKDDTCVEGIRLHGYQSDYYDAFLGIPFAKPPVGALRFANPEPADRWIGTLQAKSPKPECIQKNYLLPNPAISGEEDCLYLNVYRPLHAVNNSLPVMFYIYGGGFFAGTTHPAIHGPEYFMDTGEVLLVTVAYRLGALGFLSTGDEFCPGNFGLKDQNLALRWVKENIKAFGGDPDSVTIFGQSAGGASVHMHMLSPLSAGLFHRAVVMSGNAAAPYNKVIKYPLVQARRQAEYSGIQNANKLKSEELIKALRSVSAATIVNAGDEFKYWHVDPLTTFRPVIESNVTGSFLITDPMETVRTGNFHHVPWMTGFVPHEGAVRALSIISNETLRDDFNANFNYLLTNLMEINCEGKETLHWKLKEMVRFYLNGTHKLTLENAGRFMDMITDRAFIHPLYKTLKSYVGYADLVKNPVYLYKFSYKGPYSYSLFYTGQTTDYGVVHCDDLIYLFNSPALFPNGFNKTSVNAKVVEALVGSFVSFATKGYPVTNSTLKSCNKDMFVNSSTGFCDYLELKNSGETPNGFVGERNNLYDLDVVLFWDQLLS